MLFKGGDIICGLWKSFVGGGHCLGAGVSFGGEEHHFGVRNIVWGQGTLFVGSGCCLGAGGESFVGRQCLSFVFALWVLLSLWALLWLWVLLLLLSLWALLSLLSLVAEAVVMVV